MAVKTKAAQIKETEAVSKDNGISESLKSKLHDPEFRRKMLLWIPLPLAMLNQGITDSQGSAALLDLQALTSADDQMAALFITAYNLGYVLGSLLAGPSHGKINSYLLVTAGCVLASGANIAAPYCSTFLLMFIVRCILGVFLGFVLCIVNAEHMRIWGTQGESLLQLMNCNYALGGVIGPMMASPFITEKDDTTKTTSHQNGTRDNFINYTMTFNSSINYTVACDNYTHTNMTTDSFINLNLTTDNFINLTFGCLNHTEGNKSNLSRPTNVHYAFLISGFISVLVAIAFFITFLSSKKPSSRVEVDDSGHPDRKLPLLLKIFLAGLLLFYYLFYSSIEVTFNSYVIVFIVKRFENIGTHQAAYILTYYWALFAAGRFISIFTSKYLPARKLLYIHLFMIAASLAGLIAGALCHRFDVLTVFACLLGLSCSAMLAAGFSWTEAELMQVTGHVSAAILVGSSSGPMVVPFVVGHLVEYVSDMWFCYSLLVVFVMAVSMLAVLMTFNRCYVDRKYGKLGTPLPQGKPHGLPDIYVLTSYL
ncbi:hypothetical protein BsWGS_05089 [Bradybaena similaris]